MGPHPHIEESKLPAVVRVGNFGFALSLLGLGIGGTTVKIVDAFVPIRQGNQIPLWLWPVLILIWLPGLLGLALSFYSIARYPYLNLVTGGGPNIAVTSRWIWVPLGWVFYSIVPLLLIAAIIHFFSLSDWVAAAWLTLGALEFWFVGFLLTSYRRERHPTIATFLEITFGIGIVLFPIYLPSLMIGTIRCRRFLNSLHDPTTNSRSTVQ